MKTFIAGPNAGTALQAANLADIFTADNCVMVYEADGQYKSWVPGRELNAITTIAIGTGYIAIMKAELDVSAYFSDGTAGTVGALSAVYNATPNQLTAVTTIGGDAVTTTMVNGDYIAGSVLLGDADTIELKATVASTYGVWVTGTNVSAPEAAYAAKSIGDTIITLHKADFASGGEVFTVTNHA
jgi:hypothetical protein